MANYKPIKITFDLDDPYHLQLYEYLKRQTNGSSYIRTLLHQSMIGGQGSVFQNKLEQPQPLNYKIVEEQKEIKSEQPASDDTISDIKAATVREVAHHSSIKISVNNIPIKDDDIYLDDLI